MAKSKNVLSASKACRVEYSREAVYGILHGMYHDADPEMLRKYVDFCFDSNIYQAGFVSRKPRHQNPDIRYHHIFPKCLIPSMTNSYTNLIMLSKKDHFDAHCLLVFAFRDYFHSVDRKKSRIFCNLSMAVGATLGQLPRRIQEANRDWYANEFYKLTQKHIAHSDKKELDRDYQSLRRSTADGKAYNQLKSYMHYISQKFDLSFPKGMGVVERARSLVSSSNLPLPLPVLDRLRVYYDAYQSSLEDNEVKVTVSVQID